MDLDVIEVFLVGFALNFFSLDTRYMSVFYWRMDFIRKSENLPDLQGPTGQIICKLAQEWFHRKAYELNIPHYRFLNFLNLLLKI